MSLIKCPECGKEVSNTAEKCIQCGYPINRIADTHKKKDNKKPTVKRINYIILGIVGFFFVMFLIGITSDNSEASIDAGVTTGNVSENLLSGDWETETTIFYPEGTDEENAEMILSVIDDLEINSNNEYSTIGYIVFTYPTFEQGFVFYIREEGEWKIKGGNLYMKSKEINALPYGEYTENMVETNPVIKDMYQEMQKTQDDFEKIDVVYLDGDQLIVKIDVDDDFRPKVTYNKLN